MFTINPRTGQINQQLSVLQNGFDGADIRLVIQVKRIFELINSYNHPPD